MVTPTKVEMTIPVLDIGSRYDSDEKFQQLSHQLVEHLESVGFVYLNNHGVDVEYYQTCDEAFRNFFRMPIEEKMKSHIEIVTDRDLSKGFYPKESETFKDHQKYSDGYADESAGDARECLTFDADFGATNNFVNESMEYMVQNLVKQFGKLGKTLLHMIGVGLKLQDPLFFVRNHTYDVAGPSRSFTQMKYNYYPVMEGGLKPGQVQLGEHCDGSTITLLYQDQVGGLEVMNKSKFIPATPIPGSIIMNLGGMMDILTNGHLTGTPHRIIKKTNAERGSTALFIVPDRDVILQPMEEFGQDRKVNGSKITAGEYRTEHMKKMMGIEHELICD